MNSEPTYTSPLKWRLDGKEVYRRGVLTEVNDLVDCMQEGDVYVTTCNGIPSGRNVENLLDTDRDISHISPHGFASDSGKDPAELRIFFAGDSDYIPLSLVRDEEGKIIDVTKDNKSVLLNEENESVVAELIAELRARNEEFGHLEDCLDTSLFTVERRVLELPEEVMGGTLTVDEVYIRNRTVYNVDEFAVYTECVVEFTEGSEAENPDVWRQLIIAFVIEGGSAEAVYSSGVYDTGALQKGVQLRGFPGMSSYEATELYDQIGDFLASNGERIG